MYLNEELKKRFYRAIGDLNQILGYLEGEKESCNKERRENFVVIFPKNEQSKNKTRERINTIRKSQRK